MRTIHAAAMAAFLMATLVLASGCAARGVRNQTRIGAASAATAALAIDNAERTLYGTKVYDKATHDQLSVAILKILYTTQAYERAARNWVDGIDNAPAAVDAARTALLAALDDFEKVVPAAANIKTPLIAALNAVRAYVTTPPQAALRLSNVAGAQAIPLSGILAIFSVIGSLIQSGRTSWQSIRSFLQSQGVSDQVLDNLDSQLSGAIAAREADLAAPPADPQQ